MNTERSYYLRISYYGLIFVCVLAIAGCTSMKTLDVRANTFVNSWKGKTLEDFVKSNPDIDPFEVIDLGMGKRRHVFRYRESLTSEEFAYSILTDNPQAKLVRFIYLFVDDRGIIYDATWQRKILD